MKTPHLKNVKAVFIGASAGGVVALNKLFKMIPNTFEHPIIVVLHLGDKSFIPTAFYTPPGMRILEAEEKTYIEKKNIYFAPPSYHLLIESDFSFSLTNEEKVQFARPSLDITMDSLALSYKEQLLGIVLTGANDDGADGLLSIKKHGGLCIVQDPKEAQQPSMPQAALKKVPSALVLKLEEIGTLLAKMEGHHE